MNEQLSAWVDGELDELNAQRVVASLKRQSAERQTCEAWWLIGDAIRGQDGLDVSVSARVMQALRDEPVVLAPVARRPVAAVKPAGWMAIAAGVAAVGVAAWVTFSARLDGGVAPEPQPFAQTPIVRPAEAQVVALGNDSRERRRADVRAYLMAHQAGSMGSPMSNVAGYVRTVSDEQAVSGE